MGWNLSDIANLATVIGLPLTLFTWLVTRDSFANFWKKRGKLVFVFVTLLVLFGCWHYGYLKWLTYHASIAVWILILAALVAVGLTAFVVWVLMLPPSSNEGNWQSYVNDEIFGVRWNWRYYGNQINEDSFSPFCPQPDCRHRLEYVVEGRRAHFPIREPITLACPRCDFRKEFDEDSDGLRRKVGGEVERRINTGEFARAKSSIQ